jgi:hypothetical protein
VILCIKMFLNRGHCVALKEMVYACHWEFMPGNAHCQKLIWHMWRSWLVFCLPEVFDIIRHWLRKPPSGSVENWNKYGVSSGRGSNRFDHDRHNQIF